MIPLWAKVNGKWEPFPTHLLETLDDGSLGLRLQPGRGEHEKQAAFGRFRGYFEPNPIGWFPVSPAKPFMPIYEYRLKKQVKTE